MRTLDLIITAAGTAALATLLVGCGASTPSAARATGSATSPSSTSAPAVAASATPTAARLTTIDENDSPLRLFLADGAETPQTDPEDEAAWEAASRADWAESARLVGQCMKAEGFDYEPAPWEWEHSDAWGDVPTDTREFVDEYGLGITNSPAQEFFEAEDTTVSYVETLTETERLEYEVAMNGEWFRQLQVDPDTETPTAWQDLGCLGKASHEMEPEDAKPSPWEALAAEYGDLESAMYDDLSEKSAASPEMTALTEKWVACMAKGGHPYSSPRDMITKLYDEFGTFSVQDPERPAYGMTDKSAPGDDAFVEKEMDVAAVNYDCRKAVDFYDEARRIAFAYEEDFIDDHRAELEQYRTARQLAALETAG